MIVCGTVNYSASLTIIYKRVLANASKVSNLPAIEDETRTQVRYLPMAF